MKNYLLRGVKIFLGILSLILGLVGLLLPILPGWVFIFAGIYLIFPEHGKNIVHWLESKINRWRKKHPVEKEDN